MIKIHAPFPRPTSLETVGHALLGFAMLGLLGLSGAAGADSGARIAAALASGQPALIEFGAETCTQCKRMKVVLDAMSRRHQGRAHVIQVNVNRDKAVTREFKIMVIPTLVYFDKRGREAGRQYGYQDEVTVAGKLHDLGAR